MIRNIRHTGIVVRDLEKSVHFYQELLGFKINKKMEESGSYIDNMLALRKVKVTTIKIAAPDGQMIELLEFSSHPAEQKSRQIFEIGISHIALTVDDLNMEYKRLKDKGVIFSSAPQLSSDGYAKVAFCQDPEGNFIELVEEL